MFTIGIDFDGVVGSLADYLEGGDQYAHWHLALSTEEDQMAKLGHEKEVCIEHTHTHKEKHVDKSSPIYLRAIPGALEGLRVLCESGYSIFIATARTPLGALHARHWLLENGIDIPVVSTAQENTKASTLKKHNAIVHFDDMPQMLEDLDPHVPHRFLLHAHYNADLPIAQGVIRVNSWQEFITAVLTINS